MRKVAIFLAVLLAITSTAFAQSSTQGGGLSTKAILALEECFDEFQNFICGVPGGNITGSGTLNTVAKFTGTNTIGNSQITDNGSNISAIASSLLILRGDWAFLGSTGNNPLSLTGAKIGAQAISLQTNSGATDIQAIEFSGTGVTSSGNIILEPMDQPTFSFIDISCTAACTLDIRETVPLGGSLIDGFMLKVWNESPTQAITVNDIVNQQVVPGSSISIAPKSTAWFRYSTSPTQEWFFDGYGSASAGGLPIAGNLTDDTVPKWDSATSSLVDSGITDNGTTVTIDASDALKLTSLGYLYFDSDIEFYIADDPDFDNYIYFESTKAGAGGKIWLEANDGIILNGGGFGTTGSSVGFSGGSPDAGTISVEGVHNFSATFPAMNGNDEQNLMRYEPTAGANSGAGNLMNTLDIRNVSGAGAANPEKTAINFGNDYDNFLRVNSSTFGAEFAVPTLTADRTYSWPDASGTVALVTGGSGTTNTIPKFASPNLVDSNITDTGSIVTIGVGTSGTTFVVEESGTGNDLFSYNGGIHRFLMRGDPTYPSDFFSVQTERPTVTQDKVLIQAACGLLQGGRTCNGFHVNLDGNASIVTANNNIFGINIEPFQFANALVNESAMRIGATSWDQFMEIQAGNFESRWRVAGGTYSADRVYTWPDASGTITLDGAVLPLTSDTVIANDDVATYWGSAGASDFSMEWLSGANDIALSLPNSTSNSLRMRSATETCFEFNAGRFTGFGTHFSMGCSTGNTFTGGVLWINSTLQLNGNDEWSGIISNGGLASITGSNNEFRAFTATASGDNANVESVAYYADVTDFDYEMRFEGTLGNDTYFSVTPPTADRTLTFPDATGTVALTSQLFSFPLTSNTTVANDDVETYWGTSGSTDGIIEWLGSNNRFNFRIGSHGTSDFARFYFQADDGGWSIIQDATAGGFTAHTLGPGNFTFTGSMVGHTLQLWPNNGSWSASGSGNYFEYIDTQNFTPLANATTHMFAVGQGLDNWFHLKGSGLGTHTATVNTNPIFNAVSGAMKICDDGVCTTTFHIPVYASSGGSTPSTDQVVKYDGTKLAGSSINDNGTRVAVNPGRMELAGTAFASLPAANNGTIMFCSNCDPASTPCTTGGASTGAFAFRVNGQWDCPW